MVPKINTTHSFVCVSDEFCGRNMQSESWQILGTKG